DGQGGRAEDSGSRDHDNSRGAGMSSLSDRIRGIVGGTNPQAIRNPQSAINPESAIDPQSAIRNPQFVAPSLSVLGGDWRGEVFVVERTAPPSARHGRESVGTLAESLDESTREAALFTGIEDSRTPFVFFDIETTGLSGGAGTQAFLVGCGWFDADGAFVTRQYLLTHYPDERPMLDAVAAGPPRAGHLPRFHGKSFDAPMLETRYLFHRAPWNGRERPHLDVLHPARRFWKTRAGSPGGRRYTSASATPGALVPSVAQAFRPAQHDSCSLVALERQVLGVRRTRDVPGIEIPHRYFQFVRSGDAQPLAAVLEHNRLHLLALAALAARLLHLARTGPEAAKDAREALALGFVYARAGLQVRACDAFTRAVEMTDRGAVNQAVRIESLRALALAHRRARQHAAAAACWRRLMDAPGCPPRVVREATEALAIHHEHRDRDLETAKTFALLGLDVDVDAQPAWTRAVHHRLARLDRKLRISEQRMSLLS